MEDGYTSGDGAEGSDKETEQLLSEDKTLSSSLGASSKTIKTSSDEVDLKLPKKSKIPVPQSVYINAARSSYLENLSEQVYRRQHSREQEEQEKRKQHEKKKKEEGRPRLKSGGSLYDRLRDDDFDSFEEDNGKETDDSIDFDSSDNLLDDNKDGGTNTFTKKRRRRLRRQSSSEFGASSVELLGPSETGESDEENEVEGTSQGDEEGGDNVKKTSVEFSRIPEKRIDGKKRIVKSKTVGDDAVNVVLPQPKGEEGKSDEKAPTGKRDPKKWGRVEPTRPKSATDKVRRTPSKSPSKSPAVDSATPAEGEQTSKRTVTIRAPGDESKEKRQWQRMDAILAVLKSPAKNKGETKKSEETSKKPPLAPERKPPAPDKALEIDKWKILDPPKKSSKKSKRDKKAIGEGKDAEAEGESNKDKDGKKEKDKKGTKSPKGSTMPKGESIDMPDDTDPEKAKEIALRDIAAGIKLIEFCKHGEWYGVDSHLRYFEKRAKAVGVNENKLPLANLKDEESWWSPLMFAIKDSRIPLCERMIELGCDVNTKTKDGLYPIHIAALHARDEVVRFLLFKKADAGVIAELGKKNALHYAASRKSGNTQALIRTLLTAMPKRARLEEDFEGNIPLFIALKHSMRAACQELLTDLAPEQLSMRKGTTGDTALIMASKERDLEMIRVLTDAGADVNLGDNLGKTALHYAAEYGDDNLGKYLYLCKANPHLTDNEDRTPIFIAAMNGHTNMVDLLADKFKVSVFERAKDGSTLMHIASLHGHPETAIALFRKGVPLQMPNKGGARSIHIAARNGHHLMIGKLLEKGEKVDAVTNDNFTALHIGVESVKPQVVETLLGYGAQVHIRGGSDKETPLHIAARVTGGDKCALMLLKSGAEPNITMENGETPLVRFLQPKIRAFSPDSRQFHPDE